jgi:hypothetical protein
LRTDEKHIRPQSTILYEDPALSLLLSITVFSVRMCFFIRAENTVGARSAQICSWWHVDGI